MISYRHRVGSIESSRGSLAKLKSKTKPKKLHEERGQSPPRHASPSSVADSQGESGASFSELVMSQYDKLNTDLINDSGVQPDDTFDQLRNSDNDKLDYYSDEI